MPPACTISWALTMLGENTEHLGVAVPDAGLAGRCRGSAAPRLPVRASGLVQMTALPCFAAIAHGFEVDLVGQRDDHELDRRIGAQRVDVLWWRWTLGPHFAAKAAARSKLRE